MSTVEFKRGDRVRDLRFVGHFIGSVAHVDGGWVYVKWDECMVEDEVRSYQIELETNR